MQNGVGGNTSLAFGYKRFFLPFQQMSSAWKAAPSLSSHSSPGLCLLSPLGEPPLRPLHTLTHATCPQCRSTAAGRGMAGTRVSLSERRSMGMVNTQSRPIPLRATQPPSLWAEATSQQAGMMFKPHTGRVGRPRRQFPAPALRGSKNSENKDVLMVDCFMGECKRGAVGGGPWQPNTAPEPYLTVCHAAVKTAAGGNHSVLQKSASDP